MKFTPKDTIDLSARLEPWAWVLTVLGIFGGIAWGFLAPEDYQHRSMVRMMYIHVPTAWFSLACYGSLGVFSLLFLITKQRIWDVFAFSVARVGTVLTAACLITGALWGKPMWGAYWVWDARLTSVAVLECLYVGYWMFRSITRQTESRARICALLALVGTLNLPVIKWSVTFWTTLHQGPSVFRLDGPQIDPLFLGPLFLTTLGVLGYVILTTVLLVKTDLLKTKFKRNIA